MRVAARRSKRQPRSPGNTRSSVGENAKTERTARTRGTGSAATSLQGPAFRRTAYAAVRAGNCSLMRKELRLGGHASQRGGGPASTVAA
ncbi:hypothetical protein PAL_GLEAN10009924 [Pteropus alecto]|uniref:Uncharacterized protein n=1 Tax=Pteropus alecto TaxID=9402 RepID=L5KF04_PTEAL|nr:hypothetical protein PAL_GLEAN10009924 [Pteropus alecto]